MSASPNSIRCPQCGQRVGDSTQTRCRMCGCMLDAARMRDRVSRRLERHERTRRRADLLHIPCICLLAGTLCWAAYHWSGPVFWTAIVAASLAEGFLAKLLLVRQKK